MTPGYQVPATHTAGGYPPTLVLPTYCLHCHNPPAYCRCTAPVTRSWQAVYHDGQVGLLYDYALAVVALTQTYYPAAQ